MPINQYSLENFIEILETDIFRPNNYQRIRNNLSIEERKSLQELRSLNDLLGFNIEIRFYFVTCKSMMAAKGTFSFKYL